MNKKTPGRATIPERNNAADQRISDETAKRQERTGSLNNTVDVNRAYQIAGTVVATVHSQYHHLVGHLELGSGNGAEGMVRTDPAKMPSQDDGRTLKAIAEPVLAERDMLLMAGRQAELIHYTLHAPAESDQVIGELSRQVPALKGSDGHDKQVSISDALGKVTHHWHEIECLAAWLTRQDRAAIPSTELEDQVARIDPNDHGLFP